MKYRTKRIYVNIEKTRYCKVLLFKKKEDMQWEYKRVKPLDKNHEKVLGVHIGFTRYGVDKKGKETLHPQTGSVLLHFGDCGAGVVSHEFAHGVLWAWKHTINKKQYPLTIKSIKDEEEILHNLTYAVGQFYNWYWKIKHVFK